MKCYGMQIKKNYGTVLAAISCNQDAYLQKNNQKVLIVDVKQTLPIRDWYQQHKGSVHQATGIGGL